MHERAVVVVRLHADGPLRLGLEPLGDPGDRLAHRQRRRAGAARRAGRRGWRWSPRSARRCPARCCRGSRAGRRRGGRACPRAVAGQPAAYDGARAGLGDRDVTPRRRLSATPLAKASPSRTTSTAPSGVEPQQPPGAGVLDEVVLPLLDAVAASRSRVNQTVPSAGDRGVVAEDHRRAGDAGRRPPRPRRSAGSTRSTPAVGVADQQPAVEVELDAERPAAGVRRPGRCGGRRGGSGRCCRPRCR